MTEARKVEVITLTPLASDVTTTLPYSHLTFADAGNPNILRVEMPLNSIEFTVSDGDSSRTGTIVWTEGMRANMRTAGWACADIMPPVI